MKKIKLVFSGSGMLYPCHAGVAIRLAEAGCEFEEVCGVSGGSIIAAALASGFKPNNELVDLIKATLPAKNNAIDVSVWSLFQNWGLIKGDKIEAILEKHFAKTFADAKIPLHVVATDVSRQQQRVFNSKTDSSMAVSKAVRASMAIPFVFTPVSWGGELYVDGGWVSNFPLAVFGNGANVVGVRFASSQHQYSPTRSAKDYVMNLIDSAISSNMDDDMQEAPLASYISISTKYASLDFKLGDDAVDAMVADGKAAADKWIKAGGLDKVV